MVESRPGREGKAPPPRVGDAGAGDVATLPDLLAHHAARRATALIVEGREIGFAELAAESCRVAAGLRGLGIREGDRVTIWLPSGTAWLASLFGCARIGAIAVALNTRFRAHEVGDILHRTGSRAIVFRPELGGADLAATLSECRPDQLAALEWLIVDGEAARAPDLPGSSAEAAAYRDLAASEPLAENVASPTSPCIVFTTSGTTKAPKFVLHHQRSLIAHGRDVARASGLTGDKRMLLIPPMCGTYGLVACFAALAVGAPLVVSEAWDPAEALRLAAAHRTTHALATDDAVDQLLRQSEAERPMPTMEFVGLAGVNPALGDIFERAEPRGLHLVGLYGSSELQAVCGLQRPDASRADRAGRGGVMVDPAARVRACDPESGTVLPAGEMGELEFLVPASRMIGYLGDEAATRAAHRDDGFFRTGDLGFIHPDGRFEFVSRLGDSLRLGGFLVNPAEIEEVIETVEGIRQAQVVGIDTPAGPRPFAFVILDKGRALDEGAVRTHLAARLAKFKLPVRIAPIDAFPVTVSANATKIQKGKLREQAMSLMDAERGGIGP